MQNILIDWLYRIVPKFPAYPVNLGTYYRISRREEIEKSRYSLRVDLCVQDLLAGSLHDQFVKSNENHNSEMLNAGHKLILWKRAIRGNNAVTQDNRQMPSRGLLETWYSRVLPIPLLFNLCQYTEIRGRVIAAERAGHLPAGVKNKLYFDNSMLHR